MNRKARFAAFAAIAGALFCTRAAADLTFDVTLDTSPLIGNPAGPFSIELQLTDGSGPGDANNSATIDGVDFGGGGLVGAPFSFGGAAGSLASSLSLTDSDFANGVVQSFDPGASLRFDVALTTTLDTGPFPDELSLSLLDGAGNPIPTTGLLSAFVVVDIDSSRPGIQTFAGAGSYAGIGAPAISTTVAPVTEPAAGALLAVALLCCLVSQRRVVRAG